MKRQVFILFFLVVVVGCNAQALGDMMTRTTVYETFQPATILTTNGKVVHQRQANIFLKNSSLVYRLGINVMEASIDQIRSVKFPDRFYVRLDDELAWVIDTLGSNKLLCVSEIDIEAYKKQLLNERQITNLELGQFVNVTGTDLSTEEKQNYPLNNTFYFDIDGKIVKAHERNVKRLISDENQRIYKMLMRNGSFSWNDPASLMEVLKLID